MITCNIFLWRNQKKILILINPVSGGGWGGGGWGGGTASTPCLVVVVVGGGGKQRQPRVWGKQRQPRVWGETASTPCLVGGNSVNPVSSGGKQRQPHLKIVWGIKRQPYALKIVWRKTLIWCRSSHWDNASIPCIETGLGESIDPVHCDGLG